MIPAYNAVATRGMHYARTKGFFLLAGMIAAFCCYGQQPPSTKYQVRQFTDENGLPQNSINGMAFDNAGFVWLATQGGLVRFDGRRMTTFTKKQLSLDSDRFVRLKRNVHTAQLHAVNEYGQMVLMHDGLATRERRYLSEEELDLESISPARTAGIQVDSAKTPDNYTQYRIIAGLPGRYFLYFDQKVFFYDHGVMSAAISFPGRPHFEPFPGEPNVRKKVIAQTKGLVCVDNFMNISGKLFYHLGNEGSRLLRLSAKGVEPVELSGDILQSPDYASKGHTIRIVTNRMNGQAFAVLGACIYYIKYPGKGDRLHTRLLVERFNIDDNFVYRMLYDEANQTLFMGSFSQGLMTIRTKMFTIVNNIRRENFHNVYYAHLPFSASSVIIPDGDILGPHKQQPAEGLGFRSGAPTRRMSMFKDRDGRYWIAKDDSLLRFDPQASRAEAGWRLGKLPERLYQTPDQTIWIGFKTGEIAYLKPGAGSSGGAVPVARVKGEPTFIYQDRPGRLWLGAASGLYLFDSLQKKVYPVKGLVNKTVRSIYATSADELWITTYGDGMFLLTKNRLIELPLDENGYLLHAHYILDDEQGNFWIPTNKGLFRASRRDLLSYARGQLRDVFYLYYNREDGFFTNEFNGGCQPCGVKLADGTYSLPSMNGLVWFQPNQIPLPNLNAPLLFENLKVDDKHIPLADTIRLPHSFSHFAFDIRSPFHGVQDNLKMHYSVKNGSSVQPKWLKVRPEQQIDIYNMAAGTYVLAVRKATGFGGKHLEKRLVLVIEQAWFLSWWFITLVLTAMVLLFWLYTKWRLRSLRRQNLLLGQKVQERTAHLSEALEDLKASDEALQMQLQIQLRIIGVINHDLHSPLRYLSTHVPSFIQRITPYLPDPESAGMGSAISKSTQKVYKLADDLLRFIKATYNKKGKIVYEQVSVEEILNQKASFFAEIARENQAQLQVTCEPGLTVITNYMMLEIMIHNLVDNALKHTFGQAVVINAAHTTDGGVAVKVTDTGGGMDVEIIAWLNQGSSPDEQVPGNLGLGLIIVKEIASLLGLSIAAYSSTRGTTIVLHFGE